MKLGDTPVPAWNFRYQREGEPAVEGVRNRPAASRGAAAVLHVHGGSEGPQSQKTCLEVLTYFARAAGGRIDCPEGRFAWFTHLGDEEFENMLHALLEDRSLAIGGGGTADTTVGCAVAGRPARCTRVSWKESKRPMTMHAASIQVDGKHVLVACTSFVASEPVPPVCNGVITLTPPSPVKEPAPGPRAVP